MVHNARGECRGKTGYSGWSSDPEIEGPKEAFARASDTAGRRFLAEKIQVRAREQVHYIPLGTYNNFSTRPIADRETGPENDVAFRLANTGRLHFWASRYPPIQAAAGMMSIVVVVRRPHSFSGLRRCLDQIT